MKKIIIMLALVGLFVGNSAFAHNVYDDYGKVVSVIPDEVWASVLKQSSTAGVKLPLFYAGQSVVDEHGVVLNCEWFMFMGCQNPTKTEAYRVAMRSVAKQLIAQGRADFFPIFKGWIEEVK